MNTFHAMVQHAGPQVAGQLPAPWPEVASLLLAAHPERLQASLGNADYRVAVAAFYGFAPTVVFGTGKHLHPKVRWDWFLMEGAVPAMRALGRWWLAERVRMFGPLFQTVCRNWWRDLIIDSAVLEHEDEDVRIGVNLYLGQNKSHLDLDNVPEGSLGLLIDHDSGDLFIDTLLLLLEVQDREIAGAASVALAVSGDEDASRCGGAFLAAKAGPETLPYVQLALRKQRPDVFVDDARLFARRCGLTLEVEIAMARKAEEFLAAVRRFEAETPRA